MCIEAFWKTFLDQSGLDEQTRYFDSFHFMNSEFWANELLRLVLMQQKKATTSSLAALEIENGRVPQDGDYSIVTDWEGIPRCVIRTTKVRIMPFKDMTFEICSLEGEDENLESWQKGHRAFFEAEGKKLGFSFSDDSPIVFEEFEVVFQTFPSGSR